MNNNIIDFNTKRQKSTSTMSAEQIVQSISRCRQLADETAQKLNDLSNELDFDLLSLYFCM